MMDDQLIFAEDFAGTTAAENAFTDILDLGGGLGKDAFGNALNPDYHFAHGAKINIVVNTAAASTDTASTVIFRVKSCATTNGTYTQAWESYPYTIAALTAGKRIRGHVPSNLLRYVQCTVQPASTLTAGNFTAFLTLGAESDK